MHSMRTRSAAFLQILNQIEVSAYPDRFFKEIMETEGRYMLLPKDKTYGIHLHEYSLHGICALGEDKVEACRNWKRMAEAIA